MLQLWNAFLSAFIDMSLMLCLSWNPIDLPTGEMHVQAACFLPVVEVIYS